MSVPAVDRAVELARSLRVTRGRKLRVDATVVETNVHHPTDSALLSDVVRVLSRLLRRARRMLGAESVERLGGEIFRPRNRSVRRVARGFRFRAGIEGRISVLRVVPSDWMYASITEKKGWAGG
jgi:hypothetical protein